MSNIDCNSCKSCDFCYSCKSCDFCYSCDSCNSCKSCDFCYSCNFCENVVNGFMCINLKLDKKYKTKYWIFNKEVTKEEWDNRFEIGERK